MDTTLATSIESCNRLTSRWVHDLDRNQGRGWGLGRNRQGSWALSGPGLWWCLAALLVGADGTPARGELEQALGLSKADAGPALAALAEEIRRRGEAEGTLRLAAGLWTRPPTTVRDDYRRAIPDLTVGTMPGSAAELDPWADEHTGGLIPTFPRVDLSQAELLLASAVAADAPWEIPFDGEHMLFRSSGRVEDAAVVEHRSARYSRLVCRTTGDFDVHLLAGDPTPSKGSGSTGSALAAGLAAIDGEAAVTSGDDLGPGDRAGCLTVTSEQAPSDRPVLRVRTPAFRVETDHDLIDRAELFGLVSARDRDRGHFPDLSDTPLAIDEGRQSCAAVFGPEGFRAAAVTAMTAARALMAPRNSTTRTVLSIDHDRPFGFLVVQRNGGLVTFAGRVEPNGRRR